MGSNRTRNFVGIIYPDSLPDNWHELLQDFCIPYILSPLHDSDIDPDDSIKKSHYHLMLCYENVKTIEQAQEVFNALHGTKIKKVASLRQMARYFCHLDNPEKHQYDIKDVEVFGSMDYLEIISSCSDKYVAVGQMMDFCRENCIYSFSKLCDHVKKEKPEWFKLLCDNSALIMREYLHSLYFDEKSI